MIKEESMDCSEVSSIDELKEFLSERKSKEGDKDYLVVLSEERAVMIRKRGSTYKLVFPELGEYTFKTISYLSNYINFGNFKIYCDNPDNLRVEETFLVNTYTNRIVHENKTEGRGPRVKLSKRTTFDYWLESPPIRTL